MKVKQEVGAMTREGVPLPTVPVISLTDMPTDHADIAANAEIHKGSKGKSPSKGKQKT